MLLQAFRTSIHSFLDIPFNYILAAKIVISIETSKFIFDSGVLEFWSLQHKQKKRQAVGPAVFVYSVEVELLHDYLLTVDDVETVTLRSCNLAALQVVDLGLVVGVNLQTLDSCRAAVGVGEDSVETCG